MFLKIKLLIADDDPLIRESLKIILGMDDDFSVEACVENGQEAVNFCRANKVDIALLDVQMPVMDGVQATKKICADTSTKVLILTTFENDDYIVDALNFGAKGYLLKNNTPDKIKDAIKVVYAGNSVMQDSVLDKMKNELKERHNDTADLSQFTEREIDIIKAIAEGLSNKEISQKLFISEGTVKNYITNVLDKTQLNHRTQIAIYYLKGGKI